MSNSDGVEHLAAVHDNPFMREFGRDKVITRHDPKENVTRKASIDSLSTVDNDSEQEYGVNSGFVNKLRSKFNHLQSERSNKVSLSRKSASLENLLDTSRDYNSSNYDPKKHKSNNGARLHSVVQSSVELRKRATTPDRPRSSEAEFIKGNKPPVYKKKDTDFSSQNNFIKGSAKPPISRRKPDNSTVRQSRNSSSDITKHKIEHHDWKIAPDLEKIGRDNIVIIESSSPCIKRKADVEPMKLEKEEKEDKEDFRHARPIRDKQSDENELPKPNTVSAFRSLFENTKKAADVVKVWRPQSPTRTSQGSSSPSVSSPRSPLVRMNDENVFESSLKSTTQNKENDRVYSPRNSSNNDVFTSATKESPRNSSIDPSENVDLTSTSLQKSLDMFQKNMPGSEVSTSISRNKFSYSDKEENTPSPTSLSPRLAANTPAHPLSNIFDSSSVVKSDKPKRPKPIAVARKQHPPPKDTIELKHEAERKKQNNVSKLEIKKSVDRGPKTLDIQTDPSSILQSNDSNMTSPGRNSGKTSPRKTKIFDSSNMIKKEKPSPRNSSSSPTSPRETSPFADKKFEEKSKKSELTQQDVSVSIKQEMVDENKTKAGVTTISINNDSNSNREQSKKTYKAPIPMVPTDDTQNERAKQKPKPADNKNAVSGMSSYLVNKLKKEQLDPSARTPALTNGTIPSPVPRKRQAPDVPMVNGTEKSNEKEAPPLPVSAEPELPKTNIDDLMKRKKKPQASTKMVFDSSNIVKKKKETPKRKPPRKTIQELNKNIMSEPTVPLLDLSSITNDTPVTEYQEGYIPTDIKPCPFKFLGAEVTFAKSPYKKRKKAAKSSLKFDDTATTTFEYVDEETALAQYLQEHPEEREEARKQEEEESEGVAPSTTSNDLLNDVPMAPEQDSSSMKSNTVIGLSGAFTNYKSKIQVPDFEFGVTQEPDFYMDQVDQEEEAEDNMQLLPASDNDLDAFSTETGKADLLF